MHSLEATISTTASFFCNLLLQSLLLEACKCEFSQTKIVQTVPCIWMPDEACLAHLCGFFILTLSQPRHAYVCIWGLEIWVELQCPFHDLYGFPGITELQVGHAQQETRCCVCRHGLQGS